MSEAQLTGRSRRWKRALAALLVVVSPACVGHRVPAITQRKVTAPLHEESRIAAPGTKVCSPGTAVPPDLDSLADCPLRDYPTELRCIPDRAGAWGFEPARVDVQRARTVEDGRARCEAATLELALRRYAADGSMFATARYDVRGTDYDSSRIEVTALADYDGDGVTEMLLDEQRTDNEGGSERALTMLAFRGGAIRKYDTGMAFQDVVELTGDDRPELLVAIRKGALYDPMGGQGDVTFAVVSHADPGGRFSITDADARAADRVRCPRGEPIKNIEGAMCARLWGASAADVLAERGCTKFDDRTRREEAELSGPHRCPTFFKAWVEREPGVSLR